MARLALIASLLVSSCVTADVVPYDVVRDLAPAGKLRAAINFGNPVLAQKDPASGQARGVSVDLAREVARRADVPLELVPYDAAGKVTGDATSNRWDIAFVGREPVRIAVSRRSAYDLFLSRGYLKRATLIRAPTPPASMEQFAADHLEAVAGVKAALAQFAATHPGYRVLPGRFMVIEQAMALPRGRPLAARYLREFIDEMKASGFVATSLEKSGQKDAAVAP